MSRGPLVLRLARRRPVQPPSRRGTKALGALALVTTGVVVATEYAHVWRRRRATVPAESGDVLGAGVEAARETVEVAVEGYRTATPREVALMNLLTSFAVSWGVVRFSTHRIRSHGRFLVFRDLRLGEGDDQRHIHHFVPGIVLAFVAGGASIVSRNEEWDKVLAFPFGLGAALTLDESALLLQLEDVYWTEEGVVSVQVTLAAMALLSLLALALRMLRRGEREVLAPALRAPQLADGDAVAAGGAPDLGPAQG